VNEQRYGLIYEYAPQVTITEVIEFGASADAVLLGKVAPPAEGARFDFNLEGHITGPNLSGTFKGWTISTSAPMAAPSFMSMLGLPLGTA
jgi:hypothetical protein